MVLVDTADQEISRVVFVRGEYERIYMAAALDFLTEAGRPAGPLFLDIGANIGVSALDALLHFGFRRAVCFEPDSRSFRLLQANALLNSLDDRLEAHRVALSDSEGEAVLRRWPDNFGNSSLSAGTAAGGGFEERCTTCRLDTFLAGRPDLAGQVGLVWIDTQGHEAHILAGCRDLLASGVPVVAEYWPKGLTEHGALERFETLVADSFSTLVDLRRLCAGEQDARMEAAQVVSLRDRYLNAEFTDLLLIK
jgi:FkbM family methyltransferase